jgi:hypothetical protein
VNHRIFERTLRLLVFRGACLFERQYPLCRKLLFRQVLKDTCPFNVDACEPDTDHDVVISFRPVKLKAA